MTYGFRLRFLLAPRTAVADEAERLPVLLQGLPGTLELVGVPRGPIKGAQELAFRGTGLPSEGDAETHGRHLKVAVQLAGVALRMGLDVGKEKISSSVGAFVRASAQENGVDILSDVHGLMVFSEALPVRFAYGRATLTASNPSARFLDAVTRFYQGRPTISEKQSLAVEVYNLSHFEASSRARFLTLVTAIEVLAVRSPQPTGVQAGVAELQQVIAYLGGISDEERSRLVSSVGDLQRDSIGQACRRLVSSHAGDEEGHRFTDVWYRMRSDLVHSGQTSRDIDSELGQLDELVSRVLLMDVASGA